ncbi:MAG: hypothetical protein WBD46_11240 [Acidobacteriaceae bacterium]
MAQKYQRYRDPLELFLDDGFSNVETVGSLRAADFVVHAFEDHFHREDRPEKRQQSVKDTRIIPLCHSKKWLLVTLDTHMRNKHATEIAENPNVTILAFAHNGMIAADEWVQALIAAKPKIERFWAKLPRPWCVQINRTGEVTACHCPNDTKMPHHAKVKVRIKTSVRASKG